MYNKHYVGETISGFIIVDGRFRDNGVTKYDVRCLNCGDISRRALSKISNKKTKFCQKCFELGLRGIPKSRSRIYNIWNGMMKRCYNPRTKNYKNYGGRGISVCKEWHTFKKFFEDMRNPPSDKHSLDRINNNWNYSKANCRWATQKEQNRNTRIVRRIKYKNTNLVLIELLEKFGIKTQTYESRISRGWDMIRAIETPVNKKYSNKK